MSTHIHIGDIGIVFSATIKDQDDVAIDISAATTKVFYFQKPDGTVITRAATFITNGTDGGLKYTTVSGDLDLKAMWSLQVYVVTASLSFKTDIFDFRVERNII